MAKKAQAARSSKTAKTVKSVELNPTATFAEKWIVYQTSGSVVVNAEQLDVTEGGALVFLVNDDPLYVFPPDQYLYVAKQ